MNITYRTGYYFQRTSIDYNALYVASNGHADYAQRWKLAGNEHETNVPAMPLPANAAGVDQIYRNSNILTEKGDHIRLQDIRLNYGLPNFVTNQLGLRNLQLYAYLNNVGILWKATKHDIDPDYQFMRAPKTVALGLSINF